MFKVVWDTETGGVRLVNKVLPETLGVSPRPVFFEELDLLKLNELGWTYPQCKEPLLWACNKQYYYRGKLVFEVKGANLFNAPTVLLQPEAENLTLQPVDVETMLKRCNDYMFLAESEAIQFIRDTYLQYANARHSVEKVKANQLDFEALAAKAEKSQKQKMAIVKQDCDSFDIMPLETAKEEGKKVYQTTKIDVFLASFSGGKDSQVVLDLCTRAIPPSDFEVIYSDTGYELPTSLSLYEEVKAHYHKQFPELRFRTARNHESVLNYWDKIGTPSDTHRWCCSVMKTAPLYRLLKIEGTNKQAKVLAYEGVRAEESVKRNSYNRIGKGSKHSQIVINAHPILYWNTTEVFLYLFENQLPINPAYRIGKPRVGCVICPFSSEWDDMIAERFYHKEITPFVDRIRKWSTTTGISNIDVFLADRKWKLRACGQVELAKTKVILKQLSQNFSAVIENPRNDLFAWLPALGEYSIIEGEKATKIGELRYDNNIYPFTIKQEKSKVSLIVQNVNGNMAMIGHLRKLVSKTAYCIQCEVCEIDCPTGALKVVPKVEIDNALCIHCKKCFDLHDAGCVVADATRKIIETNKKMDRINSVHAYKSFGLRNEWLSEYFANPDDFWKANSLGTAQVDSFKGWLKDAMVLDEKNNITVLGKYLKGIYENEQNLVWEILWINLSCSSYIVRWFTENIKTGQTFDKKTLTELMLSTGVPAAKTTIDAASGALLQLFRNSPIGEEYCFAVPIANNKYLREENEYMTDFGVLYYLYKHSELANSSTLRVSDCFIENSELNAQKVLGLNRSEFEKVLRVLNSSSKRLVIADLNSGLENITLQSGIDALKAVSMLTE